MPSLRSVIDATGLFPSGLLAGMIAGYLDGGQAGQIWLTFDEADPSAIAFCAPEPMTSGTWNLYLIAVHPSHQGQGRGAALVRHVEHHLVAQRQRVMLIETSGLPEFDRTRTFYVQCGYREEARIRDFYQAGEDKVVFHKHLATPIGVAR